MSEEDLERLPVLHAILSELCDPEAAAARLEPLCREMPPLENRLVELARRRAFTRGPIDVRRALAVLGNHGLEEVLLGLLEDLTIVKADRDDRLRAR